jgi:hypothetical protein
MKRVLLSVAVALVGLILAGTARAGDTLPIWWASTYYPASYYGKTTGADSQQPPVMLERRPCGLVVPSQEELAQAPVAPAKLILAGTAQEGDSRPGWWASTYYPASYYGKTTGTCPEMRRSVMRHLFLPAGDK